MNIRIDLRKEDKAIDLLYDGYNIVAHTIYNEELTNKILTLIENELKNECWDFENFEQFLDWK